MDAIMVTAMYAKPLGQLCCTMQLGCLGTSHQLGWSARWKVTQYTQFYVTSYNFWINRESSTL